MKTKYSITLNRIYIITSINRIYKIITSINRIYNIITPMGTSSYNIIR